VNGDVNADHLDAWNDIGTANRGNPPCYPVTASKTARTDLAHSLAKEKIAALTS